MDDAGEEEFASEEAQEIARYTINQYLANATYDDARVDGWCAQISDGCLKELSKLGRPFKYIVTCIISQRAGSPLQTAATAYWDPRSDGLCSLQVGNDSLDCIVTIYAVQV